MNEIEINGEIYIKKIKQFNGPIKIVNLQRWNVLIGRFERDGNMCKLHNASVIRRWGTTRGLGQLASDGPTNQTKLDKCNGLVEFDILTMIFSLSVNEEKWKEL